MAYVPQVGPRIGATVHEIVQAVCRLRELPHESVAATARRLDLDLDACARQPVRDLSGGMRQKLLISLALGTGASLMILDEPTASLDAHSRQQFFRMIEELPQHPTLLLCSHRLEEIRHLVDRILVLAEGRLTHDGPVDDYLRSHGHGVVEVRVGSAAARTFLSDHGFSPGAGGWWCRTILGAERIGLLQLLTAELGDDLTDIQVRDLEAVQQSTEKQPCR